jgi:GntR family transcriptional regulator of arabinose operon
MPTTSLDRSPNAPPLHVQVAQILRENILTGAWKEGDSIPPEKALCAEFNIARGTLRQALQTLEAEGYLRRAQGRGTFIKLPDRTQDRPRQMAFVVPYVRDSSVLDILMGFQSVAEAAGCSVVFNHVNNDKRQQDQVLETLAGKGIGGIALYPIDSDYVGAIADLVRARYPLVLVDRYLKTLPTDYIITDHFGGALRGTHYMLNQGHTRVGFVTWLSPAVSMEHRYLGYMQALRERGLPLDDSLICHVEGYPTVDLTPLKAYLMTDNRPTAIFAANDQIAVALYRAAASLGLSIPRDIAVVGFDNLDIAAGLEPPLTTVAQPFRALGVQAAELLLRRINGETGGFVQVALPTELIVRTSCATPAPTLVPAV